MTENSTMTLDEARTRTIELIAEILEIEPKTIRGGDRLRDDLGMDSLGSLELLAALGSTLHVDLEIEDAMGIQTVDEACALVAARWPRG